MPSPDDLVAGLAARQHGVFSHSQLEALGCPPGMIRHRLKRGRWETLFRGVYRVAGSRPTWHQSLAAACLAAGASSAASHRSAAQLLRLPGGKPILEITVLRESRARISGITVHRAKVMMARDRSACDGIPVTGPARTLVDLASVVSESLLEDALDESLRRGLVSIRRLQFELDQMETGRGHSGMAALRGLVETRLASPSHAPQSVLESRLLRLLAGKLAPPQCQHRVTDGKGFVAYLDFAYPEAKLAIEADGYAYHSGRQSWQRDRDRANRLKLLGWNMLNFTASDVAERPEWVTAAVRRALSMPGGLGGVVEGGPGPR